MGACPARSGQVGGAVASLTTGRYAKTGLTAGRLTSPTSPVGRMARGADLWSGGCTRFHGR